ncbi:MAG: hypothetical protein AAGJ28_20650 [Pseudomonadota bacterium]
MRLASLMTRGSLPLLATIALSLGGLAQVSVATDARAQSNEQLAAALAERGFEPAPQTLAGSVPITWQPGTDSELPGAGYNIRLPRSVPVDVVLVSTDNTAVVADLSPRRGGIALSATVAEGLGLKPGDTVTLQILGLRTIDRPAGSPQFTSAAPAAASSTAAAPSYPVTRIKVKLAEDVYNAGRISSSSLASAASGPQQTAQEEPQTLSRTALNFRGVPESKSTEAAAAAAQAQSAQPAPQQVASAQDASGTLFAPMPTRQAEQAISLALPTEATLQQPASAEPSSPAAAPTATPVETPTVTPIETPIEQAALSPVEPPEPSLPEASEPNVADGVQSTAASALIGAADPAQPQTDTSAAEAPQLAALAPAETVQPSLAAPEEQAAATPEPAATAPSSEAPEQPAETEPEPQQQASAPAAPQSPASTEQDPLLSGVSRDNLTGSGDLVLQGSYFSQRSTADLMLRSLSRRGLRPTIHELASQDGTPRWTILIGPFESNAERDAARAKGGDLLIGAVKRRI